MVKITNINVDITPYTPRIATLSIIRIQIINSIVIMMIIVHINRHSNSWPTWSSLSCIKPIRPYATAIICNNNITMSRFHNSGLSGFAYGSGMGRGTTWSSGIIAHLVFFVFNNIVFLIKYCIWFFWKSQAILVFLWVKAENVYQIDS